jgi:hypothetical protein
MPYSIETGLQNETIAGLARHTGFLKRTRKVTPQAFLQACCMIVNAPLVSLRIWAMLLGAFIGDTLTKQAVAKRFNSACVRFLRLSLFGALKATSQLQSRIETGSFAAFHRVLLQDSTSLALPRRLAAIFPGSGNQHHAKTATLKIQTLYDALGEQFIDFLLTPFTRNDQSASRDMLAQLRPGDLVLRDLGYFVLGVFAEIAQRGAYFLSRYQHGTTLTRQDGQSFNLLKELRRHNTLDVDLRLGSKAKLPVRVVAIPVPKHVAEARRRHLRHNRNRKVNPSAEHLALLDWEIFITNVTPEIWTTSAVAAVYGIRWRIEIMFKAWKRHFKLPRFTDGSQPQIEILIYAKLLFITLFQVYIFRSWARKVKQITDRVLSLLKVAEFIANQLWLILVMLNQVDGMHNLEQQIIKHCTYERRKRLHYDEMFAVLF